MGFRGIPAYLSDLIADTITGAKIVGGTITGAVFQTATAGARWVIGANDQWDTITGYTGHAGETVPALIVVNSATGELQIQGAVINGASSAVLAVGSEINLTSGTGSLIIGANGVQTLTENGGLMEIQYDGTVAIRSASTSAIDAWKPIPYNTAYFHDFGAPWAPGEYRLDPLGYVHLRGLVYVSAAAAAGTEVFALPALIQPAASSIFEQLSSGGACRVDLFGQSETVTPNSLYLQTAIAAGGWLTLDGITWQVAGA